MREEMRAEAEEEARAAILMQAIAEREGITVTDADLQKRWRRSRPARSENAKQLRAELEKDHGFTRSRARSASRRRLIC